LARAKLGAPFISGSTTLHSDDLGSSYQHLRAYSSLSPAPFRPIICVDHRTRTIPRERERERAIASSSGA